MKDSVRKNVIGRMTLAAVEDRDPNLLPLEVKPSRTIRVAEDIGKAKDARRESNKDRKYND